jgi:hypothetical protein
MIIYWLKEDYWKNVFITPEMYIRVIQLREQQEAMKAKGHFFLENK